jgi:hypothetical protein
VQMNSAIFFWIMIAILCFGPMVIEMVSKDSEEEIGYSFLWIIALLISFAIWLFVWAANVFSGVVK